MAGIGVILATAGIVATAIILFGFLWGVHKYEQQLASEIT